MISLEKWMNLTPVQKLLKNVGDLGKFIFAKGPKSNKLPNLVTLSETPPCKIPDRGFPKYQILPVLLLRNGLFVAINENNLLFSCHKSLNFSIFFQML